MTSASLDNWYSLQFYHGLLTIFLFEYLFNRLKFEITLQHYLITLHFAINGVQYKTSKPGPQYQSNKFARWLSTQVTNYQNTQYTCLLSSFLFNTCRFQAQVLNSTVFYLLQIPLNYQRAHQRVDAPRTLSRCLVKTCRKEYCHVMYCN